MPLQLDHLILAVNDRERSIEFYTRILGLTHEGEREPFSGKRLPNYARAWDRFWHGT